MKKNSMRLLGFLLVAVMMVSLLGLGVFAGDTANDVNETASQPSETLTWKDGDVIDGITISKDVTINVSGTVTVNGTIRLAPDAICNVVFNGSENAKLIRGEGFTGQMFYAEGTSDNFQKLTFNNITLDGGAVWTGDVDKTLNRGTTNSGVKATGSVLYLVYANATLENGSVLQNHDDSTGEKANAVFLRYYSTFTVNDSVVRNNHSISTYYRGGVVTIRQGGTVKTNNADVYGNSGAAGGFVGISSTGSYGGIAEVKNSKFHNNYADNGAVFLMQCNSKIGYLSIEGCEFYENASKTAVLTEWAYSRPFIIKDSYFHDNECAVWDCHADPVLDLSGKIVVEEDADYTKYLFETPLVLGGALTDGSSIAISEASLTKLLSTKSYVVTGTADYAITNTDLAKFVLPEGYEFLVADVNFDGIMDAVSVDVDFVVSQATITLKDSLDADASETRTVIAGLAYDYGTPSAHTGFTFTGWQKDDGKAVNAPIAVTSDSILTAQWKLANPSVAVSVNGATLTATISNANEDIAYTYQWYIDGTAIDGATADTYTMTDLASHKYRCTVTASYEGYKSTSGNREVTASVPAAAQIGDVKYETLAEAIAAANAADGATTVTLLADVTLSEKLTITGDVTIEGAYTITRANTYTGTLFAVEAGATLTLDGGLTIDGGNNWAYTVFPPVMDLENGSGTKVADHITPAEGGVNATAHMIVNNGTLNVLSVTIENSYSTGGFSLINAGANSVTILDGATIRHTAANRSGAVANIGGIDAILTIKGTTRITDNFGVGNGGIIQNYGQGTTVNFEGGSIDNNFVGSSGTLYASYSSNANKINTFNMTGGIITENVMEGYGPVYIHTNTVWNMSGGEISENVSYLPSYVRNNNPAGSMTGGKIANNEIAGLDYGGGYYLTHPDLRLNGKTAITGGIYSQNVFEYLAPNSGLAYDDGLYTVVSEGLFKLHLTDPVTGEPATLPYIEGNVLASLVATGKLFYADYYEMTLEVLYDVKVDETVVIDYPMTIDLNGHTITGYSTMQTTPVFRVVSDVTVIGEGKVDGRPGSACYAFIVGQGENAGNLTIENGTFYGDTSAISVTKGTATINGGKFAVTPYQVEGEEDNYNFLLNCIDKNYKDGTAKIVVKGGTFYKFNPADNAAEGAGTSFVHENYLAEADGDYYTVRVNKDTLPTVADVVIKLEGGQTITLTYPSERFDTIQKLIGTNDYADFVLGAEQSELLAYVANGDVTDIVMNLYDDIELDAPINFYNKYFQIPVEYAITVNGNGHTISWADGYNGTLINVENGVDVTLKDLTIDGENSFTFYDDTTTVENGQNWYTRFVDVGEEDKAINDNVIVNAGNLTLDSVRITGVTIASDGPSGKTENTESGYVLMYNDDLALIKSNGGKVTINGGAIMYNAGMVLNAINAETSLNTNVMYNMGAGNKGGIIIANGGTMDIKGVITYNKAMARSATILGVINGAEVTFNAVMNYNEHIGVGSNTAGAMIVLEGASQFVMNGGTINYNEGGRTGAIASRWVGGSFGQHEDTSIVLNAGSIIGNTASNDSWNGASIFLRSPATIGEGMTIDGTIAVNAAPGALEITGGTFNNFDMIVTDGLVAEITGGTFDNDPTEWVADSYATVYSDGFYTVKPVIAEIFFSNFLGGESSITYPGYADSLQELVDYYMFCNNANETAFPGFSFGDYTPVLVIYGELSAEDVAYLGGASTDGTYVSAKPMTWTVRFADGVDADENVKAAEGYVKVDNGDGTFTVQKAVAQVGDTYFATLQDAFAACTNGETITLLVDLVYDADDAVPAHGGATGFGNYDQYNPSIIYIGGTKGATEAENQPSNVNAVLDLNGHTITNNADAYLFLFMDNCKVTIKDSKDGDGIIGNTEAPVIWVTGTDTLVTIESGKYTTVNAEGLLWSTHGGDLVIKGGEFSTSAEDASLLIIRNAQDRRNPNYFIDGKATVTIYGGTFYGFDPEKMMDDSTDPFTEFDACADGYKSIKNGNAYTVENYIEWIKQQLLLGNDVVLEKDIVVDGSMIESIPAPTNGNGKYPNYGIFNVVGDYDVTFDLNGHSITYNGHKSFEWNGKTYNSCTVAHGLFYANAGAHLTVKDSVGTGTVTVYGLASGAYVASPDTTFTITGGTWKNYGCAECGGTNIFLYPLQGGELYIEGGYFEQALDAEGESYLIVNHGGAYANSVIDYSKTKVVISGGTFVGMDPANIKYFEQTADNKLVTGATTNGCAEGYESTDNGDGTYSVIPTKLALVEVEIMPGFWGTSYITVENWADLVAALGANTNLPVKVTLLENIKLTDEVLTIAGTTKKVIDLNGKRITGTFTEETTAFVYVTGGCELTILDSTVTEVDGFTAGGIHAINTNGNLSNLIRVETDGKLVIESGSYSQDASVNGAGMIDSRGDEIITIKGGHFRLYNIGSAENGSPWIFNASSQNTKNIIVQGGTYNADIIHQYYPFEVMAPKELALVQGEDGIWHFVPAVAYVNEQEWSSAWYTNEVGYATLEDAIAAVEGIRTKNDKTSAEEFITLLADAVVTGNVDATGIKIEQNGFTIKLAAADATLTAPEGLNVTTDVANRKVVYENGVYKLAVITYAAQIGDTKYETLQDAIDKAEPGDEIIVLENINIADQAIQTLGGKYNTLFLVEGKAVTVNLNGKIISGTYTGDSMLVGVFSTDNGGKLTLTGNGTIDVTADSTVYGLIVCYSADSSIVIENGTYKLDKASDSLIYTDGDENVTVKGGSFTLGNIGTGSNGSPWIFNAGGQNTKNIIVQGGTYNADIIHQYYPFEVMAPKELALVKGLGGIWYFVPAVAYVNEQEWSSNWYTNEVGYASLEEAIAAVEGIRTKNGKTSAEEFITLLGDVMVTGNVDTKGITIVQGHFAIRLGIADATLTAVEGLNVTTDLEGYKVVYEDGTYKVSQVVIAEIFFSAFGGSETSVTYPGYANSLQELVDYYMFCNNANETAIPGFSAGDYTPVLVIYGGLSAEDVAYLGGASTDGTYVSAKPMTWTVRFANGVDASNNIKAADGYVVLTNDDGTLTVTKILASITFEFLGETEYFTYPGYADGDARIESMHDLIDVYLTHIVDRFGMYPEDPTITLHSDIALDETFLIDAQMPLGGEYDYDLTLDLNGYTITSSVTPAIRIVDDLDVTVKNGTMDTDSYCFILGASDGSSAGNLTIVDGTYHGGTSVASVTKGTLTVLGGDFSVEPYEGSYDYTLNCIDANYKDGTASIVVKGGTFYKFNPENNASEGVGTNYVPAEYMAIADGDNYVVTEWNYEIWTKADLERLSAIVNGGNTLEGVTVKLMADIDLYEADENGDRVTFAPIANNGSFNGTFEGNDHTISNLYQSGWALGYELGSYGAIGLFGNINGATIRNLTIADAECFVEGGDVGAIAGSAEGDCTLEGITVKDSTFATYNNGCGGLIGWAGAGHFTFKDIEVDEDTVIAGLWGSFDSSLGGILGQLDDDASAHFEDVHVACRIDAYNDVTASYKWYSYRMCGMLIGRVLDVQQINGTNYPDPAAADVTIGENVVVTFGDWANYHYIWDDSLSRGCQRVEAGYEYGGIDITQYPDSDISYIPFRALFGGPQSQYQGYYGLNEYEGVLVNFPASAAIGEKKYWTLEDAFAAAKDGDVITLLKDITLYDTIVTKTEGAITLDLDGYTITTENGINPAIRVLTDLTVKNGTMDTEAYCFIVGRTVDDEVIAGNLTIESGSYTGTTSVVSVTKGTLTVLGGEFKTAEGEYGATYLLNCIDANYKDGSAKIVVKGGTFYGFDPEHNVAEGADTDFVANTHISIDNGNGSYTVINYIEWIKQQLLLGNDVVLEKDIVVDGSMIESIPAPTNGNGRYPNYGIFNVVGDHDVTFDLNGHSITYNGHESFEWNGETHNSCTVAHGLFFANDGAHLTIVGEGDVIVNGVASGVYSASPDTAITIQGGNWVNNGCAECGATNLFLYASHGGELYIEGGRFEQALDSEGNSYLIVVHGGEYKNSVIDFAKTKIVVTGGTFVGMDPSKAHYFQQTADNKLVMGETVDTVAEGYKSVDNGDGSYTVVDYIKWIKAQLLAGKDVVLDRDVVVNSDYTTSEDCQANGFGQYKNWGIFTVISGDVTFDLNGHKVTYTGHSENFCNKVVEALFYANNGAKLTIVDSSADKTGSVDVYGMATAVYSTGVGSVATVKGGTWNGYACPECGAFNIFLYASHGGELYIEDGYFSQNGLEDPDLGSILIVEQSGAVKNLDALVDFSQTKVEITGGTFVGMDPEQAVEAYQKTWSSIVWGNTNVVAEGKMSYEVKENVWIIISADIVVKLETEGSDEVKFFSSIAEAMAEARLTVGNDTVYLLKDHTESIVLVYDGTILNVEDKTLTADYLVVFKGGFLTGNAYDKDGAHGQVKIDKDHVVITEGSLAQGQGYILPVWNEDHYVFGLYGALTSDKNGKYGFKHNTEDDSIELTFKVKATTDINNDFMKLKGYEDHGISVIVHVEWMGSDALVAQDYIYTDEMVQACADFNLYTFSIGVGKREDLRIVVQVVSDTGATLSSAEYVHNG